jgi:hypothetical protein
VAYRQTGDAAAAKSCYTRMALMDKYHGVPTGVFQADEHYAGKVRTGGDHGDGRADTAGPPPSVSVSVVSHGPVRARVCHGLQMPSHGTETCTVVELIWSYNIEYETLGDAVFAERGGYNERPLRGPIPTARRRPFSCRTQSFHSAPHLCRRSCGRSAAEKIAYNAMPGSMTKVRRLPNPNPSGAPGGEATEVVETCLFGSRPLSRSLLAPRPYARAGPVGARVPAAE